MAVSNTCVKDKFNLLKEFLAENPIDISKYSEIEKVQVIESDTSMSHLLIRNECLTCCKTSNDYELYEVAIPCLVFPKSKYMVKGEQIRWEEISFLICKEHLYLVDIMKQKKEYPIGWDDWDILDSLSCILSDLIHDK